MNVGEFIEQARRYASSLMLCGRMPCGQTPGLRVGRASFNATACMLLGTLSLVAQNSQIFKGQICVGAGERTLMFEKIHVISGLPFD